MWMFLLNEMVVVKQEQKLKATLEVRPQNSELFMRWKSERFTSVGWDMGNLVQLRLLEIAMAQMDYPLVMTNSLLLKMAQSK